MQEVTIPQKELEKVSEAVCQGIVASKASESQFWGEFNKRFTNIEKILATNAENTEAYRKKSDNNIEVQNQRWERTEKVILAFEKAKVVSESDKERGGRIVTWGLRVTAVGAIGSAAMWVIHKLKGL